MALVITYLAHFSKCMDNHFRLCFSLFRHSGLEKQQPLGDMIVRSEVIVHLFALGI